MLYKIDNDYYVKVNGYFVKVELVYTNDNVSLQPTNDKLEFNSNIHCEEVNFSLIKNDLLAEHNKEKNKSAEEHKFSKKYSR